MEMEPNQNQHPQDLTNPLTTDHPKEKNLTFVTKTQQSPCNNQEKTSLTSLISQASDEPMDLIPESDKMDPTLLYGLSKAHNNMLSWVAYYNERASEGPMEKQPEMVSEAINGLECSPIRKNSGNKRKLDIEEGLFLEKPIKVGSSLLKINSHSQPPRSYGNEIPIRKKKLKALARERYNGDN